MTGLNGGAPHIVDATSPYAPEVPVVYDLIRMVAADGTVVVRLVFKKPGHAITLDLSPSSTEDLERNLKATRLGLHLPGS